MGAVKHFCVVQNSLSGLPVVRITGTECNTFSLQYMYYEKKFQKTLYIEKQFWLEDENAPLHLSGYATKYKQIQN